MSSVMQSLGNAWWRLVRFGFRLLYNEMAFTYDVVSNMVSFGAWREWQRTTLAFLPPPSAGYVLELAHGTGNLQLDLYAQGYQTIGYDLSPFMGKIAARKLRKQGIQPKLVRGLAQQLPFVTGFFPAIVCTFPTRFIFQPETLAELSRILQNDGVLVVVLNGQLTGKNILSQFVEWLYAITGQRQNSDDNDDVNALQDMLKDAFTGNGLFPEWHQVPCKGSEATLLVMRKIPLVNAEEIML